MPAPHDSLRTATPKPSIRRTLFKSVIGIGLAAALVACDSKNARTATPGTEGSVTERVADVTRLLGRTAPLPTPLRDAHFVEEQSGDGRLGPSDSAAFYALTVAPADLPAWRAALAKSTTWNHFSNDAQIRLAAPKKPQPWWVSAADAGRLEFFSPHPLTGRANGWVGIAPDGRIFIHTFTL